jgi:hypothetical protein
MLKNKEAYKESKYFRSADTLKVPNIKFNKMHQYNELCNKIIKGTDGLYFSEALETLQFEMDNKGGKVKSEAIIITSNEVKAVQEEKPMPRHFNFDKTFAMFLIDSNKNDPYMALRIKDLEEFQK